MRSISVAPERDPAGSPWLVVERCLRDPEGVWQQIGQEYRLGELIRQMLLVSVPALAAYGSVLGLSHSLPQTFSSAIKLPLLFLLTPGICLPTLFLSNLLFGGRLTARQVLALCLSATMITAVFALAAAPIAFFFLVTAADYAFYVLLNVAILGLASAVGLRFLIKGVKRINAADGEAPAGGEHPANLRLIQIWLLLYAFVGTQLGWTLRPFFGSAELPFQLFRPIAGNFYRQLIEIIAGLVM